MPVKISVVIPTHRRSSLLQKCLHALKDQCFDKQHFEVIVVSDGADDNTRELVQQYFRECDMMVRYFLLDSKKGAAAARNLGWQRSQGWLVAFTDDDCVPDRDWLHDLWYAYKGEKLIAYSGTVKVPVPVNPTAYAINTAELEKASFITANCCCTKKALESTGGFDERFSMAWREDSDLEFKLLQHNIPIVKLANAIVIHPVYKAPWGVSILEQRKGMYNALLYKKYPSQYRHRIQSKPPLDYYAMVLLVITMVVAGLMSKNNLMNISIFLWVLLMARLVIKRLSGTSHSVDHVTEMIITSMIIPFASIYWQLYGAWRFKVIFF